MVAQPASPANSAVPPGAALGLSPGPDGWSGSDRSCATLRLDRGDDGIARLHGPVYGPGLGAGPRPAVEPGAKPWGGACDARSAGASSPDAALASLFAEAEAQGAREEIVALELHGIAQGGDQAWVAGAIDWLAAHGRQPVLRSSVRLHRGVIEAATRSGASVELCLAHPRVELQRALLGPAATATATLLLQSQHLRAVGLTVSARLGPLLPGVHHIGAHGGGHSGKQTGGYRTVGSGTRASRDGADRVGFTSLLSHVRAADVGRVILVLGRLSRPRLEAVAPYLGPAALLELAQGFGLTSGALLELGLGTGARSGSGPSPSQLASQLASPLASQLASPLHGRRQRRGRSGRSGRSGGSGGSGMAELGGADRLDPHFARLLERQLRRAAETRGLEVHSSASAAAAASRAVATTSGPRRYAGVVQCELFADTGA